MSSYFVSLIPLKKLFENLKIMSEMMLNLFPGNEISNVVLQLTYFYSKFLCSQSFTDEVKGFCFSNAITFILSSSKCFEFIESSRQKQFTKMQVSICRYCTCKSLPKLEGNLLDTISNCCSVLIPRLFLPNILEVDDVILCHKISVKIYNNKGMYSSSKKQMVYLIKNFMKLKNKTMLLNQIECYTHINIKLTSKNESKIKIMSTLIEDNDFEVGNFCESDFFSINQVLRCELQSCFTRYDL